MKRRTTATALLLIGIPAIGLAGPRCLAGHHRRPNLPGAALATIREKFPGARIGDVEIEKRGGLRVFEAELRWKGKEQDVQVTDSGTLVRIKTHIPAKQLPEAVVRTLRGLGDGKLQVRESEYVRSFVRITDSGIKPLSGPVVWYEVAFRGSKGRKQEVRIALSGKVLGRPDEQDEENEENDD